MKAPSDAGSNSPVTVSWNYTTTEAGSYAFLYQCQDGVQFALINAANNTASGIPCGAAFNVTPSNNSIQILPLLSGTTSAASVPFSILFVPTSGTQVEGNATIIIHPSSGEPAGQPTGSAPAQTAPAQTSTASGPTTAATAPSTASPSDLSVRIVAETVDQYGNGTVTFEIMNIGGRTSGPYTFTAQMPTRIPAPYASSLQAPLTPGSYIVNTLRFSQAVAGTFAVAVHAPDRNQTNDYASEWISPISNYSGSTYYPYTQYQTYPYQY